jgi:hypothetical protein
MKKILLCFLVVILCGMSSSALADGNELLKQCKAAEHYMNEGQFKKDEDQIKVVFCMGIVEGVGSTMALLSSREDALDHKYRVCFPEYGITNRQAVRVVVDFLVNHPKDLHKNEVALLMAAFWDAYPCKYA